MLTISRDKKNDSIFLINKETGEVIFICVKRSETCGQIKISINAEDYWLIRRTEGVLDYVNDAEICSKIYKLMVEHERRKAERS